MYLADVYTLAVNLAGLPGSSVPAGFVEDKPGGQQRIGRPFHEVNVPDTSVYLFGHKVALPVLAAPITGMETNLAGGMDEREYADAILDGCLESGTLGMVGDGASPKKYLIVLEASKKRGRWGSPIFTLREYNPVPY